ncbi:hypothetical protein YC2023_045400 [Brassica napus]
MRNLASRFLSNEIKSGQETNFWYDTWTPLDLLTSVFGEHGTHMLRTRADAYVADVCNATAEMGTYSFSWIVDGDSNNTYFSSKTWEVLRPMGTRQASAKHIWFSGATLNHAFHMWVTDLNRLPTRNIMSVWRMQVPSSCCS